MNPSPAGPAALQAALAARGLVALGINAALALAAWRAGAVRFSGVVAGILIGFAIYLAGGWRWYLVLVGFFVLGSALTKLGYGRKAARGVAEADSGRRGWSHAVANTGVGALCAATWLFTGDPRLAAAFVASLATAVFDTAGSEIGGLYGRTPISLRTWRRVPPGTEGAVSAEGTLGALGVAALLVAVGTGCGVIPLRTAGLVLLAAVGGGLYESLAAGRLPLGHAGLNFTNTLVGAALGWLLAGVVPIMRP